MKKQVLLSLFTALSASLCCITPVLTIAAGTSGIASTLSWIDPLRPYFISATVLVLGLAWVQAFSSKKEDDCGCEQKTSFFQSKKFLGIVTVFALLIVSFPSYSKLFRSNNSAPMIQDQGNKTKIEFAVKGMTCISCELHIENEVKKLSGVSYVKGSYEKGSAIVEFDNKKVDKDKIITAINSTGYKVEGYPSSAMLQGKENCTASSCQIPTGGLPKEINKDLVVLKDINQIQHAFNREPEKTRFVAILSSTCKWCLQGAESVQKAIIENMANKNLNVIIVWTNMLQSDGENTAFRAASLFKGKNITQFFDAENKFGDVAAKAVSSEGKQAWDIYMFFDKSIQWDKSLPRPFDYVHQLGPSTTWADQTKYFCGSKLTERLEYITKSL
jgi:mercuric ion transport protein